jgi:mRNA-degrading endonuclease RelE of RelBE toxin-antitoxin system
MYTIEFTQQAIDDLRWFNKYEQSQVLDGIDQQLRYEPVVETRNRKRLRQNTIADWELRMGIFRVLYNVDEQISVVGIQRIGEKHRNRFFFQGKEEDV